MCWIILVVLVVILLLSIPIMDMTPNFYIQEVYIPSLNNPNSHNATNLNTSIIIDLKIKSVATSFRLRYDDLNITLYYASNRSYGAVGHAVVPGFGEGRKRTAHRRAVVEARALPWEDAFKKISGGSTVAFTVELATRYVPCVSNGLDCPHEEAKAVAVAADFQVDASGADVSKNPIRLH